MPASHTITRRALHVSAVAASLSIALSSGIGAQVPTAATSSATATVTVAQGTPLSLVDALRMAESKSATLRISRASLKRASGSQMQARSQFLPQLNGTLGYTRTLESQFSALASASSAPDTSFDAAYKTVCAPYIPRNATAAQRQAAIDAAESCKASGGINFSKVGFGAANQWVGGLSLAQNVFTFGKLTGQNTAASAQLRSAEIDVTAQRAQLMLDVTQAYYNAALADRLVAIADSSLAETQDVLRQTQVSRQVGNSAEFDLLRAQVTYQNQQPVAIQARSNRDVAYLRLKQLLEMPLDAPVTLTTPVDSAADNATSLVAQLTPQAGGALAAGVDTAVSDRAPVREMEQAVRAQEGLLRAAKAERFPQITASSAYQRLYFPTSVFPSLGDYSQNWTVGIAASIPIFTGGRVRGDEVIAEANLESSRAQLQQMRDYAALDTRVALNQLQQAEASFAASAGTAEQAQRAYQIDEIRYKEGISTQTDLSQSRLLFEQAVANRATAARDLAVARMRLALLKDLPLQQATSGAATAGTGAAASTMGGASSGSSPATQTQTTQQRSASTSSATPGQLGGGQTP